MSTAWKDNERQAAKALGGKRNCRGANFGESLPDVSHSVFSVECKYRKRLPSIVVQGMGQAEDYDTARIPVLVLKQHYQRGSYVVLKMRDFVNLVGRAPEQSE